MTQTELPFNNAPDVNTLNGIVFNILYLNERWWTPFEIVAHIKVRYFVLISDSSCTARLRDLRKPRYGSHVVEKRIREGSRAYEYRLGV